MPEGDTIYRSARRLQQVVSSRPILANEVAPEVAGRERISQQTIARVEPRGKHLLMHLDDGVTIHSHMGMTGSWHLYLPDDEWRKSPRAARCRLDLGPRTADNESQLHEQLNESVSSQTAVRYLDETSRQVTLVCFAPKQLEVLTATEVRRHRWLSRLGPDLLAEPFDFAAAIARFRVHDPTPIGEAVMNQTLVCGIGNVYKSEILFLHNIHPLRTVSSLNDATLLQLLQTAQKLMKRNLLGTPRRTRFRKDGSRQWVYDRQGDPCFRCGTQVTMIRQGDLARSTYWCPRCQPQ